MNILCKLAVESAGQGQLGQGHQAPTGLWLWAKYNWLNWITCCWLTCKWDAAADQSATVYL